jgi:hypothetical protein
MLLMAHLLFQIFDWTREFPNVSICEKTDALFFIQACIRGPVLHPSAQVNIIEKRSRRVKPFEK